MKRLIRPTTYPEYFIGKAAIAAAVAGSTGSILQSCRKPQNPEIIDASGKSPANEIPADRCVKYNADDDGIDAVAFSHDGRLLISASGGYYSGRLKIWRTSDGALIKSLDTGNPVYSIAITPDNKRVYYVRQKGSIAFWNIDNENDSGIFHEEFDDACRLVMNHDGSVLCVGHKNGKIRIWNTTEDTLIMQTGGYNPYSDLALSGDGKTLATVCGRKARTVKIWDLSSGKEKVKIGGLQLPVKKLALDSNGKTVILGGQEENAVDVWSVEDGTWSTSLRSSSASDTLNSLALSPDNRWLIAGYSTNALLIWRLSDKTLFKVVEDYTACLAVSRDSAMMATGGAHSYNVRRLRTRNLPDAEILQCFYDPSLIREPKPETETESCGDLDAHSRAVNDLQFTPDGNLLVSCSDDNTVKLWRISDSKLLSTLKGHKHSVTTCIVTPDSDACISSDESGVVKTWSLPGGKCLHTLEGNSKYRNAITVSPDGALLITAGSEGSINIWNLKKGIPRN